MIIGTWRFEKAFDLRTEEEKSKYEEIHINPKETENGTGYADRIFKINNEFEYYFTKNDSDFGKFMIKKNKVIIERRLLKEQAENSPMLLKRLIERKLIKKKDDGFYYFKPLELDLKYLSKNHIEFGTEKEYSIWKRIK